MDDTAAPSYDDLTSFVQPPALTRIETRESLGRVVVSSSDDAAEKGIRILREKPVIVWSPPDDWEDFFSKFEQLSQSNQEGILDMFHPPFSDPLMMVLELDAFRIAENVSTMPTKKIQKLIAICKTNAHEYRYGSSALFLYASKVAHSCNPNTSYTSSNTADGCLEYKVIQPIKTGDMITFSYLPKIWQTPTHIRRKELAKTKSFLCQCERCMGPDFCRPHRCRKEACGGTILSVSLDGMNEDWECNQCGPLADTSSYIKNEKEVKTLLDKMEASRRMNMAMVRYAEEKLHPLHYLTLRAMEIHAKQCYTKANQLEYDMLESGRATTTQGGHPHMLLRESIDTGISLAMAMECIAAQCCEACYYNSNNNGSSPEPKHLTVYQSCPTVLSAGEDLLRCPPSSRSSYSCRMVQRYIPDMHIHFGEDDDDVANIARALIHTY